MRRAASAPSAVLAVAALAATLAGCGGSPAPTPTPSAVPLRTVAACAASVVVPPDVVRAEVSASAPPTVGLTVGQAVTVPVPRGARLGLTGAADPVNDGELCMTTAAGSATFVALAAGFLRVGAQVGVQPVAQMFVKVGD